MFKLQDAVLNVDYNSISKILLNIICDVNFKNVSFNVRSEVSAVCSTATLSPGRAYVYNFVRNKTKNEK